MRTGRPAPTEHGTTGYYQYWGCKCDPCRKAMAQYRKRLDFEVDHGQSRRVPVTEVRPHLQRLIGDGGSVMSIARATNGKVSCAQTGRILRGDCQYVLRSTAEALWAVPVARADHVQVPAIGLHRRVRALHAIGYTKDEIGEAMGVTGSFVCELAAAPTVKAKNMARIVAAYEQLSSTPGASELQRWRAIREGWAPPMAWEDQDLDDPDAKPHWAWVRCAGAQCNRSVHAMGLCKFHADKIRRLGGLKPDRNFRQLVVRHCRARGNDTAGLLADLSELKAQGLTARAAADQLGRGHHYIEKIWSQA